MKRIAFLLFFALLTPLIFAQSLTDKENIRVSRLAEPVNTPEDEFAPIAFSNPLVLYFSSNIKSKKGIYRSDKKNSKRDEKWSNVEMPFVFTEIKQPFYGGSFSEDKEQFYFSINELVDGNYQQNIYGLFKHSSSVWSKPIKLPENINNVGYNSIDAFISMENGEEILYFSSDRLGGFGGKDIWRAKKRGDVEELVFENPVNLGEIINTELDEISPFYDKREGDLYFSSNGHLSENIGGFDIYKSRGVQNIWTSSILLPTPFNSPYDDAYFILYEDNKGLFSSKRPNEGKKAMPMNYDLFSFEEEKEKIWIKGKIHEINEPENLMSYAIITLLEITDIGEYALSLNFSSDGYYKVAASPGKRYAIRVENEGYEIGIFFIETAFSNEGDIIKNIPLTRIPIVAAHEVVIKGKIEKNTHEELEIEEVSFRVYEVLDRAAGLFVMVYDKKESDFYSIILERYKTYDFFVKHPQFKEVTFVVDTSVLGDKTALTKDIKLIKKKGF